MPLLSLLVMLDLITWLMALLPDLCIVEVLFLLSDEAMGILGSRVTVSFPQQLFLQRHELAFCHLFVLLSWGGRGLLHSGVEVFYLELCCALLGLSGH